MFSQQKTLQQLLHGVKASILVTSTNNGAVQYEDLRIVDHSLRALCIAYCLCNSGHKSLNGPPMYHYIIHSLYFADGEF